MEPLGLKSAPGRSMLRDDTAKGRDGSKRGLAFGLALVVGLCGLLYFWTALRLREGAISVEPVGYYGLLTAGFQAGHLHVPIDPHPALLALPNPYDPVANAPYRVHDLSLWQGKYYLYFGPTPVLIWFWPFVAVTGYYSSQALAIAAFLSAGLIFGALVLVVARNRLYPEAPRWVLILGVLVLGLASPAPILAQAAEVYHVPIVAAYCLNFLSLLALLGALVDQRWSIWFLAFASLAYGLAVGARPNYLLTALGVFVVWFGLVQITRGDRGAAARKRRWGLTAAAFLPAALCGGALLLYNWQRFGSVTEFGIHYQLAGSDQQTYQPFVPSNLGPALATYIWGAGNWTPYFPFFEPAGGAIPGLFRYFPWALLGLIAVLIPIGFRSSDRGSRQLLIALATLAVSLMNLLSLSVFSGINERYSTDVFPSWLLLGGLGGLAVTAREQTPRILRCAVGGVGLLTLFFGAATFYTRLAPRAGETTWARWLNLPTAAWERLARIERGALRMEIELPENPRVGRIDPLFETGRTGDQRNWLQLEYRPGNRVKVGFFHAGLGVISGDELEIPPNRRLVIETQCGSLMPPFAHPAFAGLSRREYDALRRELTVRAQGQELLRTQLDCYNAGPGDLRIGGRGWIGEGVGENFSGQILSVERLALKLEPSTKPTIPPGVPLELELQFPRRREGASEPLLATGEAFAGDLLYVRYESDNRLRFGFDHYGGGGPISLPLEYQPGETHKVTVWLGSRAADADPGQDQNGIQWNRRLVVLFDGKTVFNAEANFHAASAERIELGFNANRHSTAAMSFSGRLQAVKAVAFESLPSLRYFGEYGEVELAVMLPDRLAGVADPLVSTGVTGAGNLVYIRYLDANRVQFGFDHWGIGAIESLPVDVDYAVPHTIRILMGGLEPAGRAGTLNSRLRVELNGVAVIDVGQATHPTTREAIWVGRNAIGGSTCSESFNGRILFIERRSDRAQSP